VIYTIRVELTPGLWTTTEIIHVLKDEHPLWRARQLYGRPVEVWQWNLDPSNPECKLIWTSEEKD
jgi:hypothetical protein